MYVGAKQIWARGEGNGTDSREKQAARKGRPQLVLFPLPKAPVFGACILTIAHWPVLSSSHAAWLRRMFQPTGRTWAARGGGGCPLGSGELGPPHTSSELPTALATLAL